MAGKRFQDVFNKGLIGLSILGLTSFNYSQQNISLEKKTNYQIQDTIKINQFVENARKYLGTEYKWGGRLTKKNPGLDCLGLIFLAYSKTFETKWYDFDVNPSQIIEKKELGNPVRGLDGVLKENIDYSKLKKGDIIYLLSTSEIKDKPLAEINNTKYWAWHTGIYSNKKQNTFIEAKPGYKVVEENFEKALQEPTKAIFVTRIN